MDLTAITILRISVGVAILSYVGYCLANQKVWVRGDIGLKSTVFSWGTKEENEFVFKLHTIAGTLIGLFLIANSIL
tara:strand:- start:1038 stop:1265 length:228 start_codon:yes stop_codon:yes gene_type:complete